MMFTLQLREYHAHVFIGDSHAAPTGHPLTCFCSCATALFFLNLVVDASFIVDMALQPFQSYWDEHHDM